MPCEAYKPSTVFTFVSTMIIKRLVQFSKNILSVASARMISSLTHSMKQIIFRSCFTQLFLLSLLLSPGLYAQQPADTTIDIENMTIEQLSQLKALGVSSDIESQINAKIDAASQRPFSTRETPNVVTVITEDEIRNSGARDLVDVLRMVPGIEFGLDVEGSISVGIRGVWASEGKVLVRIDGMEMNELMFGAYTYGNDFPIETIKRVEIIRGPGAIVNGGFAEFGVINIITKTDLDGKGLVVSSTVGSTQTGISRYGGSLAYRNKFGKDWHFTGRASAMDALRSDKVYNDLFGGSYNMRDFSTISRWDAAARLRGHGLTFDVYYQEVVHRTQAPFDTAYPNLRYRSNFYQLRSQLGWERKFNNGWTTSLTGIFIYDRPWQSPTPLRDFIPYDKQVIRFRINAAARYRINRDISLACGFQAFNDYGRNLIDSIRFDINDSSRVEFHNQAAFGEVTWKTYWFNIIAGGRIEYNSIFGAAFVPRFAVTKTYKQFSIKLLTNRSFKTPTLENLNLQDSTGLEPELTSVFELELGYKIGRNSYLTLNGFLNDQENPILYFVDEAAGLEYYTNGGRFSNLGAETEYIYRDSLWNIRASWSWYTFRNRAIPELYQVEGQDNVVLNFPQHKLAATVTRNLPHNWHLNFTGQFISARYLYTSVNSAGEYLITKCAPDAMLSLCINKRNLIPGFDLSLAAHNLLDTRYPIGQPYAGDLGPLPALSREAVVRITWHPGYKK